MSGYNIERYITTKISDGNSDYQFKQSVVSDEIPILDERAVVREIDYLESIEPRPMLSNTKKIVFSAITGLALGGLAYYTENLDDPNNVLETSNTVNEATKIGLGVGAFTAASIFAVLTFGNYVKSSLNKDRNNRIKLLKNFKTKL